MNAVVRYRALSWACAAAAIAILGWITVAVYGDGQVPVIACLTGGATLACLRWGGHRGLVLWQTVDAPAQAPRVAALILAILFIGHLAHAVLVYTDTLSWLSVHLTSTSIWIALCIAAVWTGYIAWPKRQARPPTRDFIWVSGVAITLALLYSWVYSFHGDDGGQRIAVSGIPPVVILLITVAGATIEEVVFRVLLLTALVQVSRSMGHGLILSSFAFALMHIPGAFAQPILQNDPALLDYVIHTYPLKFAWQLGIGFALGALWIRTGSITLVCLIHTILNLSLSDLGL